MEQMVLGGPVAHHPLDLKAAHTLRQRRRIILNHTVSILAQLITFRPNFEGCTRIIRAYFLWITYFVTEYNHIS